MQIHYISYIVAMLNNVRTSTAEDLRAELYAVHLPCLKEVGLGQRQSDRQQVALTRQVVGRFS